MPETDDPYFKRKRIHKPEDYNNDVDAVHAVVSMSIDEKLRLIKALFSEDRENKARTERADSN